LPSGSAPSPANPAKPAKVAPLSESRWSVQLSIGADLKAKIDEARQLLSHAIPTGDLVALVERAFDALLEQEKKRRFGAGKPRKRRLPKPGSRHIPVELVGEVTARDGGQCTFVDENGNRCSAREHLTIEHRHPFARGGATTADNLCLLCSAHNHHTARKAFGEAHVEQKILEAEYARAHAALCKMGFRESDARKALAALKQKSRATSMKELLIEALAMLVPAATTLTVRDSCQPRWPLSAPLSCPGPDLTLRSSSTAHSRQPPSSSRALKVPGSTVSGTARHARRRRLSRARLTLRSMTMPERCRARVRDDYDAHHDLHRDCDFALKFERSARARFSLQSRQIQRSHAPAPGIAPGL
jgi:5-methylcytosine-specific restriction endonuclease McrA